MNSQVWWFVARSSGIVAWALLTASVVWGLLLSTKVSTTRIAARKLRPAWLLDLHRHLGGLAVIFTAIHLAGLVADSYVTFGWAEVFVPMASEWKPGAVAFGVVAMYLLLAIEATSLAIRRLPRRAWRWVHRSSFALFAIATYHGIAAGTDAGNDWFQAAAWISVVVVAALTGRRVVVRWRRPVGVLVAPATRPTEPVSPLDPFPAVDVPAAVPLSPPPPPAPSSMPPRTVPVPVRAVANVVPVAALGGIAPLPGSVIDLALPMATEVSPPREPELPPPTPQIITRLRLRLLRLHPHRRCGTRRSSVRVRVAETFPGPSEVELDGPGAQPQPIGDVVDAAILEVEQRRHLALSIRQTGEELACSCVGGEGVGDIRCRDGCDGRFPVAPASIGAHTVAADVDRDPPDPRIGSVVAAQCRPPGMCLDERVLRCVEGDVAVTDRGGHRTEHGIVVDGEELLERALGRVVVVVRHQQRE